MLRPLKIEYPGAAKSVDSKLNSKNSKNLAGDVLLHKTRRFRPLPSVFRSQPPTSDLCLLPPVLRTPVRQPGTENARKAHSRNSWKNPANRKKIIMNQCPLLGNYNDTWKANICNKVRRHRPIPLHNAAKSL